MSLKSNKKIETICVHEGVGKDDTYNSVTTPIYTTSTFAFTAPGETSGYDYTRSGNPTRAALEECLAALEGGTHANATSTGMSAISTVLNLFEVGSHVIAGHDIYGGTFRLFHDIMPSRGVEFSFVDMDDPENVKNAIKENTKGIWIETPSNPLLNLVDIKAITDIAKENNLISIADNTFMSPFFQKPFELGVDVIVHSTTKYLNGHSDVVGGAIISREADLGEKIAAYTNALGTACSPFDAWLVLRGVKTLSCRMRVHNENAQKLAEYLDNHAKVLKVYYPGLKHHRHHELALKQMSGFGGMLSFDIVGGQDGAFEFIKNLELFAFAESLGGVESLIEHPTTMSHASMNPQARIKAGITDGTIRVSVGIENIDDLLNDMDRAFTKI